MVTSITSFPFRPSRLHSSAGQGSGQRLSSRRRTFTQLVRTAGTIFAGTVTRIAPGPAAGGSAAPTVATTFHVEHPPCGGELYDSGVAGPVVRRAALRSGGTRASLPVSP